MSIIGGNSINFQKQSEVAEENIYFLLQEVGINISGRKEYPYEILPNVPNDIKNMLSKRSNDDDNIFQDNPEGPLKLQRDLGAIILLQDNGFDFSRYQGDTTDLYNVAEEFIRSKGSSPTDLAIVFPQMVQDALKALKTDGAEPPANKMQRASDYFAERAASIV